MSYISPLTEAIIEGNKQIVENLIEKNPKEINKKDNYGVTPLIRAITFYQKDIFSYLLLNGADPNGTDQNGNSPLYYVLVLEDGNNREEFKKELEEKGAKLINNNKETTIEKIENKLQNVVDLHKNGGKRKMRKSKKVKKCKKSKTRKH